MPLALQLQSRPVLPPAAMQLTAEQMTGQALAASGTLLKQHHLRVQHARPAAAALPQPPRDSQQQQGAVLTQVVSSSFLNNTGSSAVPAAAATITAKHPQTGTGTASAFAELNSAAGPAQHSSAPADTLDHHHHRLLQAALQSFTAAELHALSTLGVTADSLQLLLLNAVQNPNATDGQGCCCGAASEDESAQHGAAQQLCGDSHEDQSTHELYEQFPAAYAAQGRSSAHMHCGCVVGDGSMAARPAAGHPGDTCLGYNGTAHEGRATHQQPQPEVSYAFGVMAAAFLEAWDRSTHAAADTMHSSPSSSANPARGQPSQDWPAAAVHAYQALVAAAAAAPANSRHLGHPRQQVLHPHSAQDAAMTASASTGGAEHHTLLAASGAHMGADSCCVPHHVLMPFGHVTPSSHGSQAHTSPARHPKPGAGRRGGAAQGGRSAAGAAGRKRGAASRAMRYASPHAAAGTAGSPLHPSVFASTERVSAADLEWQRACLCVAIQQDNHKQTAAARAVITSAEHAF